MRDNDQLDKLEWKTWMEDHVWTGRCLIQHLSTVGFPEIHLHSRQTHLQRRRFAIKVMTSGKKKRRFGCPPYLSLFALNVMCLTDRQFLFSHILLSLPLIPTLCTSADGKDSETQGRSKIPGFLWCVQICHTVCEKRKERRRKWHTAKNV